MKMKEPRAFLALFPWATFRRHKAAVKLHTLIDPRRNIPTVLFRYLDSCPIDRIIGVRSDQTIR